MDTPRPQSRADWQKLIDAEALDKSTRMPWTRSTWPATRAYELESLPGVELQRILRVAIEDSIDMAAYEDQQRREARERERLSAIGRRG